MDRAIEELKSLGARVEEVKVPTLRVATIANAVIYYNEFWAAHKSDAAGCSRMAAQRRARIYLGLLTGSADYPGTACAADAEPSWLKFFAQSIVSRYPTRRDRRRWLRTWVRSIPCSNMSCLSITGRLI